MRRPRSGPATSATTTSRSTRTTAVDPCASGPWMVDALARLFALAGRPGLVDVGVNIGQTLLKLRSIARDAPYVGFEPNPFCIQFVNELIALNGFDRCVLLPVALA